MGMVLVRVSHNTTFSKFSLVTLGIVDLRYTECCDFFPDFLGVIFLADQPQVRFWALFPIFWARNHDIGDKTTSKRPVNFPHTSAYMFFRARNPFLMIAVHEMYQKCRFLYPGLQVRLCTIEKRRDERRRQHEREKN